MGEILDDPDRRVRWLEQRLIKLEALALAAVEFARRSSRELADEQGVEAPTDDELRMAIVSLMVHRRGEWAARWEDWMPGHADDAGTRDA